jgi:CheY-like chemotaxis protein
VKLGRSSRVLLVEDNLVNQKLGVMLLERAGYSVIVESNGKDAVETFNQEKFDIVLMDI